MASFISALLLFILVLFNGYFTIPVVDEHMGFEMPPSFYNSSEEDFDQVLRKFDELSPTESMIFTTESPFPDKRVHDDLSFTTSESSFYDKQNHDDLLFTTMEPTTSMVEPERRSFESKIDEQEMQVEFTTSDMLLFTSTASNITPELYTTQSSTLTSTEKYKNHEEEEEPEQTTKLTKTFKVLPKKTNSYSFRRSINRRSKRTNSSNSCIWSRSIKKKLSYIPNDFMVLDENNTFVVTDIPERYSLSVTKDKNEQQPLSQGKESLQLEEKESNYWNGSWFGWTSSTLSSSIFVSTTLWKTIN